MYHTGKFSNEVGSSSETSVSCTALENLTTEVTHIFKYQSRCAYKRYGSKTSHVLRPCHIVAI